MPSLLAIGAGYSVRPLLEDLAARGWDVSGTTRDEGKAARLRAAGINPILWSAPAPLPGDAVAAADAVVISVAPNEAGCPALAGPRRVGR